MTAQEILSGLEALHVTVTAHGSQLFAMPASLLTDKLRASIRAHKAELLELVTASCSWQVTTAKRQIVIGCVPAVSRAKIERQFPEALKVDVAQSCGRCCHQIQPGQSGGYCTSEARSDLAKAYGVNHPAKRLPDDSGASCEAFVSVDTFGNI